MRPAKELLEQLEQVSPCQGYDLIKADRREGKREVLEACIAMANLYGGEDKLIHALKAAIPEDSNGVE